MKMMRRQVSVKFPTAGQLELKRLLELSARVGKDPLLTQASTGNSSLKLDGVLWIKASGKWMANALREDILIPLPLEEVAECLRRGLDPAERFPSASLETAMHAALPHRVVLHVHSVSTIAWAIRRDAPAQLEASLEGLRWRWLPYVASGLPLSRAIHEAVSAHPNADVFILGNHGLVLGGDDVNQVQDLLGEVERRLNIRPRPAPQANYPVLAEICSGSAWVLPDDDGAHALSTDVTSQKVLAAGVLYPCQAIFSGCETPEMFRPVRYRDRKNARYADRPFLIIEDRAHTRQFQRLFDSVPQLRSLHNQPNPPGPDRP